MKTLLLAGIALNGKENHLLHLGQPILVQKLYLSKMRVN